jgi:hypothetical protein
MAIVVKSLILKSISGKLGEFVVRQYKDRTIVSMRPDRSRVRPSRKQKAHQAKFKRAVKYAKRVMENEKLRARYEEKVKKGKSIFQYLVREYMKIINP